MISYRSTRGGSRGRTFEDVLLAGLAEDGGLFVPENWPVIDLQTLAGLDYPQTVARVLAPFAQGCFDEAELLEIAREAYAGFAHAAIASLRQIEHDSWLLELFHGPTLAFKDFALQMLGRMFERVLERRGRSMTIVGATSGDTGSAAIHACAGRRNMRICILHPQGRVSEVQRRQMTTVVEDNVENIAIRGTFDDCQNLLKAMFADLPFREDMRLAAVNSINWARIAAQAAYYFYAGVRLRGEAVFSVPTGNFGDVYAGYIAMKAGLPVRQLVVATNRNDILARFFETGVYATGEVHPTMSPSMDIQVASNFERLLFEMAGHDGARIEAMMAGFRETGSIEIGETERSGLAGLFVARRVDEDETARTIRAVMDRHGYLMDPHTAVGFAAGQSLAERGYPLVTLATAHPAKFPQAVRLATGVTAELPDHMKGLFEREERCIVLDNDLSTIMSHIRSWSH
ncbi:MAG: threonine synthase [Geminicoccaceae bacterium]